MKQEEAVAVIWDSEEGNRYWCIGFYVRAISDEEVQVDHLTREVDNKHEMWMRPDTDDVQVTNLIQVLPVEVRGNWVTSKPGRYRS